MMKAFSNEKKKKKNKKYTSPPQSYHDSFIKLNNTINNIMSDISINILSDNKLIEEVENKFISDINEIMIEIKKIIEVESESEGKYELLNKTFYLNDESLNYIEEIGNELKEQLIEKIEEIYKDDLDEFNEYSNKKIKEEIENINSFLNDKFIATETEIEKGVNINDFDDEIEIISLQKSTIDDIVKGFENYKEEINNIFNEDKLIEQLRIL